VGWYTGGLLAGPSAKLSWEAYKAANLTGTSSYAIGRTFEQWFYQMNGIINQQVKIDSCRFDAVANGVIYELKNYDWSKYSYYGGLINKFVAQAEKYLHYINEQVIKGETIHKIVFYFSSKPPQEIIEALQAIKNVYVEWVK